MNTALDAAEQVLAEAGEPLHYREIARRAIDGGGWHPGGKTPEASLNSQLCVDMKKHGSGSRFRRVAPGTFALKRAGSGPKPPDPIQTLSFTDATEQVLNLRMT